MRESSATIGSSGQKRIPPGSMTLLPQTSARYLQKKAQKRVQLKQNSESSSILGTKVDIKSTRILDPQKSASPISSRGTNVLSFKTQNPALSCKIKGLEGENAELKEKLIYVEKEREFYRGEIHKIMEKVNEMNERDQLVMEEINLLKKENAFLKEKMNHILRSRSPKNCNNSSIASTRGTHTPKRQFSESGTASASSLLAAISGNVSGMSGGGGGGSSAGNGGGNNSIMKPLACHSSSSSIVAQNSFHNSRNKYRALGQRRSTSLIKAINLTRTDKVKNVLATQSIESFSSKLNLNSQSSGGGGAATSQNRILGGTDSENAQTVR